MDQRDTGKEDGLGHHGNRKMGHSHRDTVEGRSFHEKQGLTNLQVEIGFGQLTKCGVPTLLRGNRKQPGVHPPGIR